jgi:maltooligosyltrehalose trehalohydrolase
MSRSFAFEGVWGVQLMADGQARFRLWAPGQQTLSLIAEASGAKHAMGRREDGWFELDTDSVPVGTGYMFELADGMRVPDPAARAQIGGVHGPSRLVDPRAYRWRTANWRGRPWHEAVIYELHVGTFSPEGTFAGVESRLDHLADIGITAIELMPVAQFSGDRGWGYDGVLLYAPHVAYGGPEGLKSLIDAAHERGLMVLLDVVYNHFGPDGNYLHLYAPEFFAPDRQTPWGVSIDYTRPAVRSFLIENALYWLEEYRFDGLRLDAIDHIHDPSSPSIMEELASVVRSRIPDRHVHLTTEDSRNITALHARGEEGQPLLYTAEWNDDVHHVAHVLATGEADGYYVDYQAGPAAMLARALASGYVYQGEDSPYFEAPRGEPSGGLPPVAFVDFLQNHDQIGNRAFGERMTTLAPEEAIDALTAILLLSPHIPLLYMGEEWGETRPFLFFTDFHGELGDAVREGRRNEFRRWRSFQDPLHRERIPDPNAQQTFQDSKLNWNALGGGSNRKRLSLVKRLLALRQSELMPRLAGIGGNCAVAQYADGAVIDLAWRLGDGSEYTMTANLSGEPWPVPAALPLATRTGHRLLFELPDGAAQRLQRGRLEAWSVVFTIGALANNRSAPA